MGFARNRVLPGVAIPLALAGFATAQAGRTVWDGVFSEVQARRGEAIYAERCATCHAPDLSGMDQAPALTGPDFGADWNSLSMNDLFERTRVSMPADQPGSLDRQHVSDVIAFVLQKNNLPAGSGELPSDADALKAITYLTKRP